MTVSGGADSSIDQTAGIAPWLALEREDDLLDSLCPSTGIPVWPAIRMDVFRMFIRDRVYSSGLETALGRGHVRRLIAAGARSLIARVTSPPMPADYLIVTTGAGLIRTTDGRLSNRYTDYFASVLGVRAWTHESLEGDQWPSRQRGNPRLSFAADERLNGSIASAFRVRSRDLRMADELVDRLISLARDSLGWELGDKRRQSLVQLCGRRLAAYPNRARVCERLLHRVRPSVVLIEEGCYGRRAVFNWTAKAAGALVVEFQHGMITRAHEAYNVGSAFTSNPIYQATQPDVFLAYGPWWNSQFNAPVPRKLVIGNPHRAETLKSWRPNEGRRTVVVLGDGVDTDATLTLARDLGALLGSRFRVSFRPHPMERKAIERSSPGVSIDMDRDLYQSLASAHAVIGEASTAMFEAVGLVDRVVAWDTPKSRAYLGSHGFERADSATAIAQVLHGPVGSTSHLSVEDLWADRWRERFELFLRDPLIQPLD